MMVHVERRAADDAALMKDESFGAIRNQLCTFREGAFPLPSTWGAVNLFFNNDHIGVAGVPVFPQVMTTSPTAST